MPQSIVTIFGGLPVVADVSFGKDADGPWGYGEYWAEVNQLYWVKKDGTPGKALPEHLFRKAVDNEEAEITLQVSENLAAEQYHAEHPDDPMDEFDKLVDPNLDS